MLQTCGTTTTATAATMDAGAKQDTSLATSARGQIPDTDEENIESPPSPGTAYQFDESQCLFCNQTNPNLDQNLAHMSKAHGLHIDHKNLLVDVVSLLAYFHVIISGCYECLYCGTQRNKREAVQQHMMAKGHCKYDITDKDAELREFYEVSASEGKDELHQNLRAMRRLDDPSLPWQARTRKTRPPKRSDGQSPNIDHPSVEHAQSTPTSDSPHYNADTSSSPAGPPPSSNELSTRAQKQEHTLNNQLAQLRAGDQRSLAHLPASQQRAMLATHHKQMENARRTEQTQRGNLESAGNHFSRLGTVRLIRKPPHMGNVSSLNR